jgi:ElaB/YqjD/DUF883 family membrane-anchored ribosome-binding protein
MSATVDNNHHGESSDAADQDAISAQFYELFDGVEDLIKRVAEVDSPEIQKIRAKARAALIVARSAVQDGAVHIGRQAQRAASATDDYLREYPWYALGLGTLLGFGAGLLLARRSD